MHTQNVSKTQFENTYGPRFAKQDITNREAKLLSDARKSLICIELFFNEFTNKIFRLSENPIDVYVSHLLVCPPLPKQCTQKHLYALNKQARWFVQHWIGIM